MPKVGMEPIRREALVKATIHEVGQSRSLDVTVSQIARRAGMSSGLAHHYFGGKDQIFLAAMRRIMTDYRSDVHRELARPHSPQDRVVAILRGNFSQRSYSEARMSAWMQFYPLAQKSTEAARLFRVYRRRLQSNLTYELRSLCDDPRGTADILAALIDGVYIRSVLGGQGVGAADVKQVIRTAEALIGARL